MQFVLPFIAICLIAWGIIIWVDQALQQMFNNSQLQFTFEDHRRQPVSNKNNKNENTKKPTYDELLTQVASLTVDLSNAKKIAEELRKNVTDFMPNGHHMVPDDVYAGMKRVLGEHNEIMPVLIVAEAMELGLLDKTKLQEYTADQIKQIDTIIMDTDTRHYYLLMDAWLDRNGAYYGFKFRFVDHADKKKEASTALVTA